MREVLKKCQTAGVLVQTLPGLYQLAADKVSVSKMRDVEVEELLGREQIRVDLDEIMGYIEDQVVLVTGGGGSIGSELCRQIATKRPRQLIIFDIYENGAYEIEQELCRKCPQLNLLTLIGSVRDQGKIDSVFAKYKPTIVFNAAAHKHVPLMETSPCEAVKNNVFGTLNVARAADQHGARRFVQISTDKAVNPTNIMGLLTNAAICFISPISLNAKSSDEGINFKALATCEICAIFLIAFRVDVVIKPSFFFLSSPLFLVSSCFDSSFFSSAISVSFHACRNFTYYYILYHVFLQKSI